MFAYCGNNPVMYSDPSGEYYFLTANTVIVERGDTMYYIAKSICGDGNAWQKIGGYYGSVFAMPEGTVLDVSALFSYSQGLGKTGTPNSKGTIYNPDGTPKQHRWYGDDGKAIHDRDYNHSGNNIPFPHDHEWNDGKRGKEHLPPDPTFKSVMVNVGKIIGTGLLIAAFCADDLVGGAANDYLIPQYAQNIWDYGCDIFR